MKPLLSALVLLSSCASTMECTTPCGAHVIDSPQTCAEINAAEAEVLEAYSTVVPKRYTCAALAGAAIEFQPGSQSGTWTSAFGPNTRGIASWPSKHITLAEVPLGMGAYPHEAGHLIDYMIGVSEDHYHWQERGWCAAQKRFWAEYGAELPPTKVCP